MIMKANIEGGCSRNILDGIRFPINFLYWANIYFNVIS